MYNIHDMSLFKLGKLDMPLPEGVEKPTMEIQNQDQDGISTNVKKDTGFQKIIKRIFKKKLD